jgi:adenylate cyclase
MIYEIYFRLPSVSIGSNSKQTPSLSSGPSIAVLPFKNVTGKSEQDFFTDGLTENIITGISANPRLFVIAQHSTFSIKNKKYKLQKVADEFGIEYVVLGSVQRANDQVRINVRLVDANTGKHLWTQRYDRDLKQIFEIQDEITIEIMRSLEVELTEGEQAKARLSGSRNLESFMRWLKALGYWRSHNSEDNLKARKEAEAAIKLAPDYSEALALLSMTYIFDIWYKTGNPIISLAQASKYIKKAISVDENNSDAYSTLSHLCIMRKQHDSAIAAGEKAVVLNPNGADAYMALAFALYHSGKPAEAIEVSKKAFRLNPLPPSQYYHMMGHFNNALERYDEAEKAYKRAVKLEPNNIFATIGLTYVYSLMGNTKKAAIWAEKVRTIDPNYSADDMENSPNKDRELIKRCTEALRRAGL